MADQTGVASAVSAGQAQRVIDGWSAARWMSGLGLLFAAGIGYREWLRGRPRLDLAVPAGVRADLMCTGGDLRPGGEAGPGCAVQVDSPGIGDPGALHRLCCIPGCNASGDLSACPLLDASPLPQAIAHAAGALRYLNAAFIHAFGYTREDLPTWTDWFRLGIPDLFERDLALRMFQEPPSALGREGGPRETLDLRVRCRDGTPRTVIGRVTPLDGGLRLCTFCDITELRHARDVALTANAAKSAFLAHMSHEIRTPLNALLVLVQALEQEPLDESHRRIVGRIRGAGDSLVAILNDILDLSKIEAGELRIEQRPFDLRALLAHLDSLLGPAARAKGLLLRIETPVGLPGWLVGDGLRLEQVLTNLIGNAIKFTERGAVGLRVEVREAGLTAVRLRFCVSDTGIGMTPADLARVFVPFTQVEPRGQRRFGGTGLGLSICKRLVEQMGGEIGAESTPGAGSRFWFELPLGPAADQAGAHPAGPRADTAAPPVRGPRLPGMRLLVVDDNSLNRDALALVLTLEGANVALACDGRQAVELLRADPEGCDGVLMDVQMPVMDGLTATRLIRTELGLEDLPIIAFTGAVFDDELAPVRTAGVTAVLQKPPDLGEMIDLLSRRACTGAFAAPPATGAQGAPDVVTDPGAFPVIAGIERARAARTLGGNRALFLELLERFIEAAPGMVVATRAALVAGAPETAARHLHTLKDNAGLVGAIDLVGEAQWLAGAVERGITGLETRLNALDTGISALIAASAPWRGAGAPLSAAVTVPVGLAERLEALRESLHIQSLDAFEHFDELRPALLTALGEDGCERLGRAIRGLRFSDAAALLPHAGFGGQT